MGQFTLNYESPHNLNCIKIIGTKTYFRLSVNFLCQLGGDMRLALVLLIGLAALTDATPLEAHSTTTEKTSNSGNNN